MQRIELFHRYLFSLSVPERTAFARRCGKRRAYLQDVAYGNKPCPAALAVVVERESGGAVPAEATHPKVDWAFIRGTAKPVNRRSRKASK